MIQGSALSEGSFTAHVPSTAFSMERTHISVRKKGDKDRFFNPSFFAFQHCICKKRNHFFHVHCWDLHRQCNTRQMCTTRWQGIDNQQQIFFWVCWAKPGTPFTGTSRSVFLPKFSHLVTTEETGWEWRNGLDLSCRFPRLTDMPDLVIDRTALHPILSFDSGSWPPAL